MVYVLECVPVIHFRASFVQVFGHLFQSLCFIQTCDQLLREFLWIILHFLIPLPCLHSLTRQSWELSLLCSHLCTSLTPVLYCMVQYTKNLHAMWLITWISRGHVHTKGPPFQRGVRAKKAGNLDGWCMMSGWQFSFPQSRTYLW